MQGFTQTLHGRTRCMGLHRALAGAQTCTRVKARVHQHLALACRCQEACMSGEGTLQSSPRHRLAGQRRLTLDAAHRLLLQAGEAEAHRMVGMGLL